MQRLPNTTNKCVRVEFHHSSPSVACGKIKKTFVKTRHKQSSVEKHEATSISTVKICNCLKLHHFSF